MKLHCDPFFEILISRVANKELLDCWFFLDFSSCFVSYEVLCQYFSVLIFVGCFSTCSQMPSLQWNYYFASPQNTKPACFMRWEGYIHRRVSIWPSFEIPWSFHFVAFVIEYCCMILHFASALIHISFLICILLFAEGCSPPTDSCCPFQWARREACAHHKISTTSSRWCDPMAGGWPAPTPGTLACSCIMRVFHYWDSGLPHSAHKMAALWYRIWTGSYERS